MGEGIAPPAFDLQLDLKAKGGKSKSPLHATKLDIGAEFEQSVKLAEGAKKRKVGKRGKVEIGKYELKLAQGASWDAKGGTLTIDSVNVSGKAALVEAEAGTKGAWGEAKVEGEAVSASGTFKPLTATVGPDTAMVEGEAGGELVLVKVKGEAKVELTLKNIYSCTLGPVIGYFSPGSRFAKPPEWTDHGIVLGAEAEAGVGAAAKASYKTGIEDGVAVTKVGLKAGAGPMAGFNLSIGVK